MPEMDQRGEQFLHGLFDAALKNAEGMAPFFAGSAKKLSDDEIDMAWNTRELTVEQEWDLWREQKPDGKPMYTPEEIGLRVFPKREKLAKSGGRVQPKDWIKWTNQLAERQFKKQPATAEGEALSDGMV